jgi:predicted outer membrane repeat protein
MEVAKSSFDSNEALNGGAVYNEGISIIYDSTFMENFAGDAVSKDFVAALLSSTQVDCQLTIDVFL